MQDHGFGQETLAIGHGVSDVLHYKPVWTITKYADDEAFKNGKSYEEVDFEDNLLLTLLAGGAGTAFSNANAYLGVGDSSTAEAASQTGLQAATNKTYVAMDASFPTYGSSQQIVFQATFGGTQANYAWNEFIAINGNGTGTALNRKVSSQGTKTSGQTWVLKLTITIS